MVTDFLLNYVYSSSGVSNSNTDSFLQYNATTGQYQLVTTCNNVNLATGTYYSGNSGPYSISITPGSYFQYNALTNQYQLVTPYNTANSAYGSSYGYPYGYGVYGWTIRIIHCWALKFQCISMLMLKSFVEIKWNINSKIKKKIFRTFQTL